MGVIGHWRQGKSLSLVQFIVSEIEHQSKDSINQSVVITRSRVQIYWMMDHIKGFSGYSVVVSPPARADPQKFTNSYTCGSSYPMEKPLNQSLNLASFKTHLCQNKSAHDHKQCKFYHSKKDKRRPFQVYFSDLCETAQQYTQDQNYEFECPYGDSCQKCHNKVEQLYCLEKYKTKFCASYPGSVAGCEYGIYCPFAHSEDEVRMELIHHYNQDADFFIFHYKTLWCPFSYIKHDRSRCVYAHSWQDYRRKPNIYQYDPVPCPSWNPNNFIMNYEEQCKNQSLCNKCHGWKQVEYHPLNYKMRQCSTPSQCPKGKYCPYVHDQSETRRFSDQLKSGFFLHHPRNRRTVDEVTLVEDLKLCFGKESTKVSHEDSMSDSSYDDNCEQGNDKDEEIEAMVKKLVGE